MTIFHILLILNVIIIIFCVIFRGTWAEWSGIIGFIAGFILSVMVGISIWQPIALKNEAIRQEKERIQIVYQIKTLNDDKDRVKLNEWILTYNDWVNDINTNKDMWGWFSWYRDFDMSNHTIINLV